MSVAPLTRAALVEAPDDLDELIEFFHVRRWSDGLPIVPPTRERVERMLACTQRKPDEVIATVAPGYGAATVERIAINAVMAGCRADYLPVLIAATQAVSAPEFNLQGIQATTNPVAVWLIINGPVAEQLGVNGGANCLGQGAVANATLGRALRLILQNIGGALPGDMDRATHGQPGKFSFCCAENEAQSPWAPLHVDRGFRREQSTVTVVGAAGTHNMNTHAKDVDDLLRVIADTMAFPASNDYWIGGEPWIILSPEHAEVLHAGGLSKADVQRRLWEQSRMSARRMAARELMRTQAVRESKIGPITEDTMLAAADGPEGIGILVAGGPGTHSVYVASFGDARAVTREVLV
jgi:hypothetical protein